MLTKPNSILKGQQYTFSIVKADLLAVIPVIQDDPANLYYRNMANWKTITIRYKSSVGGQLRQVLMDATVPNPSGKFESSPRVRDSLEVESIMIGDFDGSMYPVKRDLLNPLEFDIEFDS